MSKFGGILFAVILLVVVFGIVSFSAEFIFGRPLTEFFDDLMFLIFKK
jgi:hypothetical protein